MPQPLSHAVIAWHVRRRLLEDERDAAQTQLTNATSDIDREALRKRLDALNAKVRQLGPAPDAKMG